MVPVAITKNVDLGRDSDKKEDVVVSVAEVKDEKVNTVLDSVDEPGTEGAGEVSSAEEEPKTEEPVSNPEVSHSDSAVEIHKQGTCVIIW